MFHCRQIQTANESAMQWEEWLLSEEEPLWLSERLKTTCKEIDLDSLSDETTTAASMIHDVAAGS